MTNRCPACLRYFADAELLERHECRATADTSEANAYARLDKLVRPLPSVPRPEGTSLALAQLDVLTEVIDQAQLLRHHAVEHARGEGYSWSIIGEFLGMTKQAAQQRYGTKKPTVDTDQLVLGADV